MHKKDVVPAQSLQYFVFIFCFYLDNFTYMDDVFFQFYIDICIYREKIIIIKFRKKEME